MRNCIIPILLLSSIIMNAAPIVKNGSFEKWESGGPAEWKTGQGVYEKESTAKIDGRYAVKSKPDRLQKTQWPYSSISQVVTLKPQHNYKLSCYMSKDATGTHSINLTPLNAGGKPLFSIRSWSWPMPYTCFEKQFTTGDAQQYLLEFQQYSSSKSYVYLDKVEIIPLKSQEQRKTEFGIFTQSAMRHFSDAALDRNAVVLHDLSLTLTKNEIESVPIILAAGKKALPKVTVVLKQNPKNSDGAVIPAENIVIRSCVDSVLPLAEPRDLAAGKLACWQAFVKSGKTIAPGNYIGSLSLQSNGKELKTIPISIEIVDILLPEADITFGTYHTFAYFPEAYISTDYLRKIFADMKTHGMNSVTIYNNPEKNAGEAPDYEHNQQFNNKFIPEKYRKWSKKLDPSERYDGRAWTKRFNIGLTKEMNLGVETGLLSPKHPVLWLVTKSGHYGWGGINTGVLKQVLDYWKQQSLWPEPLLYVMDEPSGMPEREKIARLYFARLAKANIKVKTVTAHPDPDEMGHLYDVWILGASKVNYRNFEKALKMNRGFWMYNCSIPNSNAPYFRAMYGFSAFASKVSGVWSWAYYDARTEFVSAKDGSIKDISAARLSKVGLSPAGPVPTVAWEAMREGTEDYRLAQYFQGLYRNARKNYRLRLAKLEKILSSSDISMLRKIDKQKYTKPKPGKEITWTASNPAKKQAAEEFINLLKLEESLAVAYRAKTFLLDMIPDTLAPAERVPMDEWKAGYIPGLGESDACTAAEVKRMALIAVIVKLQSEMK